MRRRIISKQKHWTFELKRNLKLFSWREECLMILIEPMREESKGVANFRAGYINVEALTKEKWNYVHVFISDLSDIYLELYVSSYIYLVKLIRKIIIWVLNFFFDYVQYHRILFYLWKRKSTICFVFNYAMTYYNSYLAHC